jgi:dihydrodipicolinate synthase/N-acetylneuraminate lyase
MQIEPPQEITMSIHEHLKGIFPVVPTPLLNDESLDLPGLHHIIHHYIDSGCHGFLMLGSGGEFPYFTYKEKMQIVKAAIKAVKGRLPLLVGAGFSSIEDTKSFIAEMGVLDIDGFVVIIPTYYPVQSEDLYTIFNDLCSNSKKPILYYHYPQMTGLLYSGKEMTRLLSINKLAGMKESSMSLPDLKRYSETTRGKGFSIFTGNSFFLLKTLTTGGSGAICQIPAFSPGLVVDCYNAWSAGDFKKARHLQHAIQDMIPVLNSFSLPKGLQKNALKIMSHVPFLLKSRNKSRHAIIKEILRQKGHPITSRVRTPLPQIKQKDINAVEEFLNGSTIY